MSQITTYDQVGLAEDVDDVISNLSPTSTPFISSIGEETTKARVYEWQEDALADPADNARVEGFDAASGSVTATVMRTNTVQIFEKTVKVSETADAVQTHGRAKESSYQAAKKGKEIKRDLERACVGVLQAAVTGDAATPRRFASALSQIAASVTRIVDGDAGSAGNQPRALQEADILGLHQTLYEKGSEDVTTLMIKPADSLIVSGFAAASGRTRDIAAQRKVVNAVDLYISPFGELKVVINRQLKSTEALILDPSMWKLMKLRGWKMTPLAKTGDNNQWMLVGEYGLKHRNQEATGRITNLA
jgi:hypothetical protein